MSYLQSVMAQPKPIGQFIVIAGPEGAGKTRLIAGAPNRIYVPMELGGQMPNSLPLLTQWEQVVAFLDETIEAAKAGQFAYSSIAWDTVTAMERLLFDYTVRNDPDALAGKKMAAKLTMESSHGGYGKAYAWARDRFIEFLAKCDLLAQNVGTHHVFACHTFTERVIDPSAGEFDTVSILLHSPRNNKTYGNREIMVQRADLIGYLRKPILVNKGEKFNQALDAGQGRVLGVDKQPSYVAKNRYSMDGDLAIPVTNGWNVLAEAVWNATQGQVDIWNREQGTN